MNANATFHSKMKNHNRSLPAFLAAPLLIAIIALTCVALASYAAPAQAQSEVVLVSNTAQTASGNSTSIVATSFGTGASDRGFTVSEVSLRIESIPSGSGTVVSASGRTTAPTGRAVW